MKKIIRLAFIVLGVVVLSHYNGVQGQKGGKGKGSPSEGPVGYMFSVMNKWNKEITVTVGVKDDSGQCHDQKRPLKPGYTTYFSFTSDKCVGHCPNKLLVNGLPVKKRQQDKNGNIHYEELDWPICSHHINVNIVDKKDDFFVVVDPTEQKSRKK